MAMVFNEDIGDERSWKFAGLSEGEMYRLNAMAPFYYVSNPTDPKANEESLHVIWSVGKRSYHSQHLTISLNEDWKNRVFHTLQDLPLQMKQNIARNYKGKYERLEEKMRFFDKFREENAEMFI